jgi:hypothetical protein
MPLWGRSTGSGLGVCGALNSQLSGGVSLRRVSFGWGFSPPRRAGPEIDSGWPGMVAASNPRAVAPQLSPQSDDSHPRGDTTHEKTRRVGGLFRGVPTGIDSPTKPGSGLRPTPAVCPSPVASLLPSTPSGVRSLLRRPPKTKHPSANVAEGCFKLASPRGLASGGRCFAPTAAPCPFSGPLRGPPSNLRFEL